jgi:hypothetical protein
MADVNNATNNSLNKEIYYVDIDNHDINKKVKINYKNIEYCEMTVINSEQSLLEGFFSFFSNYEHGINDTDSVILAFASDKNQELYEVKKSNPTDICKLNIDYKYYSYGCCPEMPKSILFDKYYLSYIEPKQNDKNKKYELKTLSKLFNSYTKQKNIKLFASKYNSTYFNIHCDTILFGICKIQYDGQNSSRFVIAYDKTLLDKDMIKTMIKDIFIDKKNAS